MSSSPKVVGQNIFSHTKNGAKWLRSERSKQPVENFLPTRKLLDLTARFIVKFVNYIYKHDLFNTDVPFLTKKQSNSQEIRLLSLDGDDGL